MSTQNIPREEKDDPFDRQKCIRGWDNELLSRQVCLVLGVGGLGTSCCLALARLGVAKIIILDYDTVDISNLNRQVLYSRSDVGRRKVDAAVDSIRVHAPREDMEIVSYHMDALANWGVIVEEARSATMICNCIDVGSYFDYAVLSLCKANQIPYVSGSSYATTVVVEFFTGHTHHSSMSHNGASLDEKVKAQLEVDVICDCKDISFISADPKPPTRSVGSSCLVAATCGLLMVNAWVQALFEHQTPTNPEPEADPNQEPSNEIPLEAVPNWMRLDVNSYWSSDEIYTSKMPEV